METQNTSIVESVRRSLRRAGFHGLIVDSTECGAVRLSGCVASPADRSVAHALTRTTAGVTHITNDLTVS